jgi:hypothetical protein
MMAILKAETCNQQQKLLPTDGPCDLSAVRTPQRDVSGEDNRQQFVPSFALLTALVLRISVFWDVMLYPWIRGSRRFEGTCCHHSQPSSK